MKSIELSLLAVSILCGCADDPCLNTPYSDASSPDGEHHVVIFDRDCNKGEPFSTQVSVLPRSKAESGTGNVLVVADRERLPCNEACGGPRVAAVWLDSHTVQVRFDSHVKVIRRRERYNGITVRYSYLDSGWRP